LSKRTDSGRPGQVISTVPGQDYGDAGQQHAEEAIAPMQSAEAGVVAPVQSAAPEPQGGGAPYAGGDFDRPSERPGEPVTEGAALGPGAGPEALQLPNQSNVAPADGAMTAMLSQMAATNTTGVLAALYEAARKQGV